MRPFFILKFDDGELTSRQCHQTISKIDIEKLKIDGDKQEEEEETKVSESKDESPKSKTSTNDSEEQNLEDNQTCSEHHSSQDMPDIFDKELIDDLATEGSQPSVRLLAEAGLLMCLEDDEFPKSHRQCISNFMIEYPTII